MKNCVFCSIAKEAKSEAYRIIFENDSYIAMLVLNPQTKGHFILYPKKHHSQIDKLKNKGEYYKLAISLAEKFTKKLSAKAYVLKQNNNLYNLEDNNLHIGHVHIHIIPKYKKSRNPGSVPKKASKKSLAKLKNYLT